MHSVVVVILCGSEKFVRDFMLTAHGLHMTGGEYSYIIADQVPSTRVFKPWVAGDGQDETARLAFESVLQVSFCEETVHWRLSLTRFHLLPSIHGVDL